MKAKGGRTIFDGKTGIEYARYDKFIDVMSNDEYRDFTVNLFKGYDKILKENGVVLYNISYGNENSECMFLAVSDILTKTDFTIGDVIIWKKKSALPACLSPNKLTRITEYVFVFCRKEEYMTYHTNKKVVSVRPTGQKMYNNLFNFIEAPNNDGVNGLNAATYSTELCEKLLSIYGKVGGGSLRFLHGNGDDCCGCKEDGHEVYRFGDFREAV